MNIYELNVTEFAEPNLEFQNKFNEFLDLCEFSMETKLGLLFFLGVSLPGSIASGLKLDDPDFKEKLNILSAYSKSSGEFKDYGDLDDSVFSKWIYNANLAIIKMRGNDEDLDSNLRIIPKINFVIGKSDIDENYLKEFKKAEYNLNLVQNFNDHLFIEFGRHLFKKGYSLTRAYEAGFAYRMMMLQMDIKGTNFLISELENTISPLYQTLLYSVKLFFNYRKAFNSNQFFSQIFQNFYGGIESPLGKVVYPIHTFHQLLFYKENSIELRDEWLFNKKTDDGSAIQVFRNSINIRKTGLIENKKDIINSGEVYDKKLIDATLSELDFLKSILKVIQSKYGINGKDEFLGAKNWNTGWNNKGEYIQFLVILFYETCLHAAVVKEIN